MIQLFRGSLWLFIGTLIVLCLLLFHYFQTSLVGVSLMLGGNSIWLPMVLQNESIFVIAREPFPSPIFILLF
jgi:F0F1-type ATP synthase assembly protein I